VFPFHRLAVVLAEDVVQFLLGHETVAIWVNAANGERDLFHSVVCEHHRNQLRLGQPFSFLDAVVDPMAVKVAHIACEIHLELLIGLIDLHQTENLTLFEVLLHIVERLDVDDRRIAHV